MNLEGFLRNSANDSLVEVIQTAVGKAESAGVATHLVHLCDALLQDSVVSSRVLPPILEKARAALAEQISGLTSSQNRVDEERGMFAFALSPLAEPAIQFARDWGVDKVTPLAFLAAILNIEGIQPSESAKTQELLRAAGLTVATLMPVSRSQSSATSDFTYQNLGFGTDLTAMARSGIWASCPLIGMERELRRLVMLMSSGIASVVVVGEPGIGKSAIIHGLAWHLAHKTRPLIPPEMDVHTIVSISTVNIMAGTGGRGELEERLDKMLTFFRKHPTVIPFFDEIHTLLDTDDPASRSVSTALKPPMVNGQFRCIGATTDKEYARYIANDEAMNSRFTRLLLPEPDEETTAEIIEGILDNMIAPQVKQRGLRIHEDTVRKVVRLTGRYQRNDCQPRKSIQLIRSSISEKDYALQTDCENTNPELTPDDVVTTFSDITGIPVGDLDEHRNDFFIRFKEKLEERIIGQSEAINEVTDWLALHAKGWLDPLRPRGRFLFLGPPGVGKTELAMALAEEVMKDRGSIITKNMGEYKGEGARTRFMGSDPGYVGYGEVSTVYSEVMMRPYSIVVLDEFEKSHPSMSDLLLSIFDGRAEDAQGRSVDFAQCIFVFTSNALHQKLEGQTSEDQLREQLCSLGGIWSAPLVDRIDRIVLFQPLNEEVLLQILDGMIAKRKCAVSQSLPEGIDDIDTREQILQWAMEGEGKASARRLERALMKWLTLSQQF